MGKLKKYCSLYLGFHKEFYKMKTIKIILVILLVAGLVFVGYKGFTYFKQWEANRFSEINILKTNQDLFLKKVTSLSESITHIVNDTVKTTVNVIPDKNYESLKEQVITLKKDEDANKDKIEELREQLSEQRKKFLASDDTILIKDIDGNSLLLYRDSDGALQPASAQISKIIEHKDIDLAVGDICSPPVIEKKKMNIKAGLYYDLIEKNYGGIISKQLIGIKDYSLNISLLSDMLSLEGLKIGTDLGYSLSDNMELGVGINHKKDIYIKFQYTF